MIKLNLFLQFSDLKKITFEETCQIGMFFKRSITIT